MPTLLLRLTGPMQSWGTSSRFHNRDTGKEPSKSGVIGLLAAALGIDRENWVDLEPLTHFSMGVRHDRPGMPGRDYQTAGCAADDFIVRADGSLSQGAGVVSQRFYIADAAFLVGLEHSDCLLLDRVQAALHNPVWPLFLGRKSYVPSQPVWLVDGLQGSPLRETLKRWPWICRRRKWESLPRVLSVSYESMDGSGILRMDQPLSSFAERRFGARFILTERIPFPGEAEGALV